MKGNKPERRLIAVRLLPGLEKPFFEAMEDELRTQTSLINAAIKEYLEKRGYITSKKK